MNNFMDELSGENGVQVLLAALMRAFMGGAMGGGMSPGMPGMMPGPQGAPPPQEEGMDWPPPHQPRPPQMRSPMGGGQRPLDTDWYGTTVSDLFKGVRR